MHLTISVKWATERVYIVHIIHRSALVLGFQIKMKYSVDATLCI